MSLGKFSKTKEFAAWTVTTVTIISILMFVVILPGMNNSDAVDARQDMELK